MAFHDACISRVEKHLGKPIVRRTRTKFSSPDDSVRILCAVSKAHTSQAAITYWFAFHPHQKEFLEQAADSYLAFGCGSEDTILLIPFGEFRGWLDDLWTTVREGGDYWHVRFRRDGDRILLDRRSGRGRLDVSEYRLPAS